VPGQVILDVVFRKRGRGHDHAGGAEAALEPLGVQELLLHGV
jgi:hypothetical protein